MSEHGTESTTAPALREPDMVRLAEELVASATDRGVALTGEGGLLTAVISVSTVGHRSICQEVWS